MLNERRERRRLQRWLKKGRPREKEAKISKLSENAQIKSIRGGMHAFARWHAVQQYDELRDLTDDQEPKEDKANLSRRILNQIIEAAEEAAAIILFVITCILTLESTFLHHMLFFFYKSFTNKLTDAEAEVRRKPAARTAMYAAMPSRRSSRQKLLQASSSGKRRGS